MATTDNPQKGDIGTEFVITIKRKGVVVNISSATIKEFKFVDPSGNVVVQDAEFVTDGSDGKLMYETVDGDLSAAGEWKLQTYLEMVGWEGHTKVGTFTVDDNYEEEVVPPPVP